VTVESLGGEKNLLFLPPVTDTRAESLATGEEGVPGLWTARLPALAPVRAGNKVEVAIDLGQAYFFDPDSTEALPLSDEAPLSPPLVTALSRG
jgi:hypothetical protein